MPEIRSRNSRAARAVCPNAAKIVAPKRPCRMRAYPNIGRVSNDRESCSLSINVTDPLGIGAEAQRYGSAFHYHDHGYASPFGWDRESKRLHVLRNPKHDMFFDSDEEFRLARVCFAEGLIEVYGSFVAKDVNLNVAYEPEGATTEHRLWYSGHSSAWDLSHYLSENPLPNGLHTERKSYLYSLLITRNFQRYSGYGLYSVYNWRCDSDWMKFLGLQLPTQLDS